MKVELIQLLVKRLRDAGGKELLQDTLGKVRNKDGNANTELLGKDAALAEKVLLAEIIRCDLEAEIDSDTDGLSSNPYL